MKYVAFIRGIGPTNPNMHGAKLREFFEGLEFTNVQTVIASGNVLFETRAQDEKALEAKIEKALPEKLGFSKAVIIRNHDDLKKIVATEPFKGVEDTPSSRLNVSFLKAGGEVFSVIDTTVQRETLAVMKDLEKKHHKAITMRTWKTVMKILKKLEESRPL